MTEGTSQGLFIVVAIVIFGIFVGLAYTAFGSTLQPQAVKLFTEATEEVSYKMNTASGYNPVKEDDVVFIQDADLQRVIKDTLKLDKDHEINLSDMKKLDIIMANLSTDGYTRQYDDIRITSLNGLEHATNLTQLWLHGNAVESLEPIKDLTNLKIINFNSNEKISDLTPLTNLVNLEKVMIGKNNYTSIEPLKNLEKLTMLNISKTNVSDISVMENFTLMTDLHIYYLPISDISVLGNMKDLTVLHIYNTNVIDFSVVENVSGLVLEEPSKSQF